MEVSGQLHAPAGLPPGREPLVLIVKEAGWAPEPVWTWWWGEKFLVPTRAQSPDHPTRSFRLLNTSKNMWRWYWKLFHKRNSRNVSSS